MENTILGVGNLFYELQYFYLPYYMSSILESFTDSVVLQSTVFENCAFNKGIETASGVFTQEGFTQLLMRVSSSMAYSLPRFEDFSMLTSGY